MKFRPDVERDGEFMETRARVKGRLEELGLIVTVQKEFAAPGLPEHWDAAEAIAELAYEAGRADMQRQILDVMTMPRKAT